MNRAIQLAKQAAALGEVPVGAVVVDTTTGQIIAEAYNQVETLGDATAHAELLAIKHASTSLIHFNSASQDIPNPLRKRGRGSIDSPANVNNEDKYLTRCDLYVTLEPCAMCAGAISHARIRRLIFGAYDPKSGGVEHGPKVFNHATTHHKPEVIGGVEEANCSVLLTDFFKNLR